MSLGVIFAFVALITYALGDTVLKKIADFDWFSLSFIRISMTVVLLAGFILGKGDSILISFSDFLIMAVIGILGISSFVFFILSMRYAKASIVSPIVNSFGIIVLLLSWIFYHEILKVWQYLGMAVIIIGIFIVHKQKGDNLAEDVAKNKGFYYAIAAFFMWGILYFLMAIPVKSIGAFKATFYLEFMMLVILIFMLPFKGVKKPSGSTLVYMLIIAVSMAIGGVFMNSAVSLIGAGLTNSIMAGIPLGVLIMAAVWLKERLKSRQYFGISLIIIGLFLLSFTGA